MSLEERSFAARDTFSVHIHGDISHFHITQMEEDKIDGGWCCPTLMLYAPCAVSAHDTMVHQTHAVH